jgi:hypothetical protein
MQNLSSQHTGKPHRESSAIQLDRLRIASPCPARWEQMNGDDRARFCELCNLHVYNIAELTASEARSLIANAEGRICARLYRRADGTVITKDCPVGLRAIRRRVARVAGAVFAAILSLCGGAVAQKMKEGDKACRQQVKITRTATANLTDNGTVVGTIMDFNGAVVPNASVAIRDAKLRQSVEVKTDDEGRFKFSNLTPGDYQLVISSPWFENVTLKAFKVSAKETVTFEATLLPSVTMGVIVESPLVDRTSSSITTIISGEMIRRLPIP